MTGCQIRIKPWTTAFPFVTRTDREMPLSGCHVVISERAERFSLKVFDARGRLLGTVFDDFDESHVIQGAWRGVNASGASWALVVGRSRAAEVTVTFTSDRGDDKQRIDLTAVHQGDYWCAEAAVEADRVLVTVKGKPAGESRLRERNLSR
jgi:hypothetical protein